MAVWKISWQTSIETFTWSRQVGKEPETIAVKVNLPPAAGMTGDIWIYGEFSPSFIRSQTGQVLCISPRSVVDGWVSFTSGHMLQRDELRKNAANVTTLATPTALLTVSTVSAVSRMAQALVPVGQEWHWWSQWAEQCGLTAQPTVSTVQPTLSVGQPTVSKAQATVVMVQATVLMAQPTV